MPQATQELRAEMKRRFGDSVDCAPPMRWLEAQGYKQTPLWEWVKPSPEHVPTDDEENCIEFLFQEWDMGGIAG